MLRHCCRICGRCTPRVAHRRRTYCSRHFFASKVEVLERRALLSFAASLSGPIEAVRFDPYTAYIHSTGSQSPSSETFNFDGGNPGTQTISNPSALQSASNTYSNLDTTTGRAINANVTPSGGSQFNIPLTLNSAFGGLGTSNFSGKAVTPPAGATSGNGYAVDIDSSGNIYLAGSHTTSSGARDFAVTKFTAGGALMTTFGNGGTATIDFGGTDIAYDIELELNNTIGDQLYVAGTTQSGTTVSWAIAKLAASDGSLNTNFDGDGKRSGFQAGQLNAVHGKQGTGDSNRIVLAGTNGSSQMAVYVLNIDTGATVWSQQTISFGSGYSYQEAFDALVQVGDDKVVVGGWACRNVAPRLHRRRRLQRHHLRRREHRHGGVPAAQQDLRRQRHPADGPLARAQGPRRPRRPARHRRRGGAAVAPSPPRPARPAALGLTRLCTTSAGTWVTR